MNFNQKTYVFRFKNICFLFLVSQKDLAEKTPNGFFCKFAL